MHPSKTSLRFWAVPGRLMWYWGVGWKLIMYMLILHYAVIQLRYSRTQADPQDQEGRVQRELDHARAAACPRAAAGPGGLCQKQGRIDRSDCTRTANPRPLADPGPGGAGRGRTGDAG